MIQGLSFAEKIQIYLPKHILLLTKILKQFVKESKSFFNEKHCNIFNNYSVVIITFKIIHNRFFVTCNR